MSTATAFFRRPPPFRRSVREKEVQKKPPIPFKTPYDKFFTVQGIYCGKEKVPNSRSDKPVYRPVVKFGKRVSLDAPELEKFKFKTKTKKTNKKEK